MHVEIAYPGSSLPNWLQWLDQGIDHLQKEHLFDTRPEKQYHALYQMCNIVSLLYLVGPCKGSLSKLHVCSKDNRSAGAV